MQTPTRLIQPAVLTTILLFSGARPGRCSFAFNRVMAEIDSFLLALMGLKAFRGRVLPVITPHAT